MLNYSDAALVQFAIEQANLNADEMLVIHLREHQCQSIERAAETMDVSDMTVKRKWRSAMNKLDDCWSGKSWVQKLIKS